MSTENENTSGYRKMRNQCQYKNEDSIYRSPYVFARKGVVNYEPVEYVKCITGEVYCQQIYLIKKAIRQKTLVNKTNAGTHTDKESKKIKTIQIRGSSTSSIFNILRAYSFCFDHQNISLVSVHSDRNMLKTVFNICFSTKNRDIVKRSIENLPSHRTAVVEIEEDYILDK